MNPTTKLLQEPVDVERRLAELNLSSAPLRAAVAEGAFVLSLRTENSTVAGPPVSAWDATVTKCRDELAPLGWKRSNRNNRGLIIDPVNVRVIEPVTGDGNTGTSTTPRSNQPRGVNAQRELRKQSKQLVMFPTGTERNPSPVCRAYSRELWNLLFRFDSKLMRAFLELSQPRAVDEHGYICDWTERIILESIDIDLVGRGGLPGTPPLPKDELVIDVTRKQG